MSVVKNAYVIKSWSASNRMDGEGNDINIEGRAGVICSILNVWGSARQLESKCVETESFFTRVHWKVLLVL